MLPDGWRWESYRGVQVAVPAEWGWASGDQRLGQWCVQHEGREPVVGRPGFSTLVGCMDDGSGGAPAETLVANTGDVVAFVDASMSDGTPTPVAEGGDREVVELGDVIVVVQTSAGLREQIVATVHEVEVDAAGCPSTDPISEDGTSRPDPAVNVATLTGVTSVATCRYAVAQEHGGPTGLVSSSRLEGDAAAAAGPNRVWMFGGHLDSILGPDESAC